MPQSFDRDDQHMRRHGMLRKASELEAQFVQPLLNALRTFDPSAEVYVVEDNESGEPTIGVDLENHPGFYLVPDLSQGLVEIIDTNANPHRTITIPLDQLANGLQGLAGLPQKSGMLHKADYQGWTNDDTWHTNLLLDQDNEIYQQLRSRWNDMTADQLRDWALQHVIGPHNNRKLEEAREWNSIPMKERFEVGGDYDQLSSWQLEDEDPSKWMIDPWEVNWEEILESHRERNAP